MRRAALKLCVLFGAGLFPAACSPPDIGEGPAPVMEAADCPEGLSGTDITCATVSVLENRARPEGETISIYVVRVAAKQEPAGEPLFVLRGGPGIPAASRASSDRERWRALNQRHDLVFVDTRGTGRSAPLDCAARGLGTPNFFNGSLTVDDVVRCRDTLSAEHDLAQFTTAATADDLNAVRRALGYEQVALFGASYGSYLAQVYAQRHPDTITRMVLHAPVPMAEDAWAMAPDPHYLKARQTDRAIMEVIADCAQNAACGAAYANLEDKLASGLASLAAEPVEVPLPSGDGGEAQTLRLTMQHVLNLVNALLYDTADSSQLPIFIELLASGRYQPIAATFQRIRSGVVGSVHWGLYLSIFCNEVYARIDPARALAADDGRFATADETAWGLEACRSWPEAESVDAASRHESLDMPTLILTGELDPVVPSENTDLVRVLFPVGATVVFANTAHSPAAGAWEECSVPLIQAFLSDSFQEETDTTCADRIERPDFYIPG